MTLDLLIPVYNQANSIERTLRAALSQNKKYNSIIVSDNWSTDGTSAILEKYTDKLQIIKPVNHFSMVDNWNFLASYSNAKWISFCSGDDLVSNDHSACISETISRNPRQSFIAAGFNQINTITRIVRRRYLFSANFLVTEKTLHQRLLTQPLASFSSFAIRKNFFEDIGGYNRNYKLNMDWIMQLSASKHSGIKRIHRILASYYINDRPSLTASRISAFEADMQYYISHDLPYYADYQGALIDKALETFHKKGWI